MFNLAIVLASMYLTTACRIAELQPLHVLLQTAKLVGEVVDGASVSRCPFLFSLEQLLLLTSHLLHPHPPTLHHSHTPPTHLISITTSSGCHVT